MRNSFLVPQSACPLASTSTNLEGDFFALHPEPNRSSLTAHSSLKEKAFKLGIICILFIGMIGLSNSLKAQCTWAGLPLALTGSTGTSYTGNDLHITGNLTITATATWTNCKVKIDSCVIITVDDGVVFTLNGTCIDAAQNKRWRTIRIRPTGELVTSNSCYFADADTVINSINGGKYTIASTTIEKSFVGIRLSPFSGTHTGTVSGLTINGSASMYTSCFNSITQSRYGIHVAAGSGATANFGSGGGATNRVADCEAGIFIEGSNSTIKNFDFTSMNTGGNQEACIVAEGVYGTSYTLHVGGPATNEDVYMTESENGVYVNLNYNVTVEYSTLEFLSRSGILINDCDARDLLVQHCYIRDVGDIANEWGVLVDNCDNSDITINDNFLTFSNSYQTGTAIWVTDNAGSNNVWIARDTITNRTRGIKTENCYSATIEENIILEVPTGPSNNVWGIMDYGGDKNTILGNHLSTSLYSNNVSIWPKGIFLNPHAIGILIQCNIIDSLNTHIEIEANNSYTEYVYGNWMYKGYRGLTLVDSTGVLNMLAGNIGPQGLSGPGGFTSENRWDGGFVQACVRSNYCGAAGFVDFVVKSASLPWNASSCMNGTAGSGLPTFTVASGLDSVDCSQYYTYRMSNTEPNPYVNRIREINDSLPEYFQWNAHFGNLTLLRDVENMNTEEQEYLNEMQGTNVMKIIAILSSIRAADYPSLLNEISGLIPTCQQEQNFKDYLTIFLTHVQDHSNLSDSEIEILEGIISQCPNRAGKAQSYAKSYLGLSDIEYDYNNCGDLQEDIPFISLKSNNERLNQFSISPNPILVEKSMDIHAPLGFVYGVEILDLTGRILFEEHDLKGPVQLSLGLGSGIYSVRLIPVSGKSETKRLIVIK